MNCPDNLCLELRLLLSIIIFLLSVWPYFFIYLFFSSCLSYQERRIELWRYILVQIVPALTPSLIQYALGLRTIWTLTLVYIICMDVFLLSWLLSVFVVDVDLDPKRKIGATFYFYIRYLKVLFAFKGAYTRGKFLKSGTHCPTLWSLWYMVNVDYAVGSLIKKFIWSIPLYYRNSIDRIRILRQSWDEWAFIMNARLMRGPSRQEDRETNMKKLRLSLPNLRKNI